MKPDDIVIVAAKRTPNGALLGNLASLSAPELAKVAHQSALQQASLAPNDIDEVISGCVLPAGMGQAPARQASILAGIPNSTGATTINKVCGSGMKAVMLAHDLIKAGSANIVLAGGMESMSNAPYLLEKARAGYRIGHGKLLDHMYRDGLEDAYQPGQLMGCFADATAKDYQFTREQQDEYAIESMKLALQAQKSGAFNEEIVPLLIQGRQGEYTVLNDEGPDEAKLAKVSRLKPAFSPTGTVTAANASSIADGAASLILMSYQKAQDLNIKPLAKIIGHSTHAQEPALFTTAPIGAIQKLMRNIQWNRNDVDLYEINEAFAVVAMAAIQSLELQREQVNVHGGACALGHPIGASGARILVTLIYALKQHHKQRGIATLCIGGGEATAMAIELC